MTGDGKPGDASADKAREEFTRNQKESELALTRLEIRAEQRSSNWEEDSGVIHAEALQRVAAREVESDAPPSKASPTVIVLTMVRKFPAWGAVLVALAGIGAYVALKLLGK
jgi:hypothetical protein